MATDAARVMPQLRARAPDPPRLVFLAVILAAHAVAIYFMMRRVHVPRIASKEQIIAIPIFLAPIVESAHVEPRRVPKRPARILRPKPQEPAAINPPAPPQESNAAAPPVTTPVPGKGISLPDWTKEAKEAAQRYVREHPPADDAAPTKPPTSIFDKESPHHAGDVDILAPGVERLWMNSQCYREFGHMPTRQAGGEMNAVPITCLGPSEPRGDLFEDLKPDYLKKGTR